VRKWRSNDRRPAEPRSDRHHFVPPERLVRCLKEHHEQRQDKDMQSKRGAASRSQASALNPASKAVQWPVAGA
jgi:hypothetical protein